LVRWRFISAAVIISVVIAVCWLDVRWNFGRPGLWLTPLAVVFVVLATREVLNLLRAQGLQPIGWIVHAGTLLVMLSACLPTLLTYAPGELLISPDGLPLLALAIVVFLAFAGEMRRYEQPGGVIVNVALTLFTACYIGLMTVFIAKLRFFGGNEVGMAALLSMVAVTKMSDVGAFTFGKMFGRHKLVPRLSPGKTIEGALGGIAAACVGSFVMLRLILPAILGAPGVCPWWSWLTYGVLVGLAGMFGDLAESLLKRDMDQKDSGTLAPGLGGALDFLDSLLFAAPVAYACWALELIPL
jgi:phosphatidate cytidylyltransferase